MFIKWKFFFSALNILLEVINRAIVTSDIFPSHISGHIYKSWRWNLTSLSNTFDDHIMSLPICKNGYQTNLQKSIIILDQELDKYRTRLD